MGIPTMICGGNNIPRQCRALTKIIHDGGYQLIHCHGSRANMVGALLRKPTGLPVVSTVHSDYKLDYMGASLCPADLRRHQRMGPAAFGLPHRRIGRHG